KAFESAVKKRAIPNCFIGLSSGYDSGAIASLLIKEKIPFKAYVIEGREDKEILSKRLELIKDYEYIDNSASFKEEQEWVKKEIEPYKYIRGEGSIQKDSASIALSKICRLA